MLAFVITDPSKPNKLPQYNQRVRFVNLGYNWNLLHCFSELYSVIIWTDITRKMNLFKVISQKLVLKYKTDQIISPLALIHYNVHFLYFEELTEPWLRNPRCKWRRWELMLTPQHKYICLAVYHSQETKWCTDGKD